MGNDIGLTSKVESILLNFERGLVKKNNALTTIKKLMSCSKDSVSILYCQEIVSEIERTV